jgi:hypothetical protein
MFNHGSRPRLHQIEAQLEGCEREKLSMSSYQPPSVPVTEVLPVVLRHWTAIGKLATALYAGREITHATTARRWA